MKALPVGNLNTQSVWSLWSDLDNGGFNFPRSMMNTPSPFLRAVGPIVIGRGCQRQHRLWQL